MTSVEDLLRDQAAFETQRANFDTTWQRIGDLIWPAASQFHNKTLEGQRKDFNVFDSTGSLALAKFQAAMESVLTPRTQRWHVLTAYDKSLRADDQVKLYCEQVTDILFAARYNAKANFTGATGEHYMSLGAFGNGCTYVTENPGKHLHYRAMWTGEVWVGADGMGLVDTVHRKFDLTARQAVGYFRDKCPSEIVQAAQSQPNRTFTFIHCVKPRNDADPGRRDYRGMPWASYYVCRDYSLLMDEGGYTTMPYLFSRFQTAPRETYGRGPASQVLPSLNTTNEMQKTLLRAGQKAVDPPLMLPDDDVLNTFNLRAGALNYGAVNSQGQAMVLPLQTGANMPLGREMIQDEREVINTAFFVTLFQILVDSPRMTATEAILRAQEKGDLLAPAMGPQQGEYLSPLIERELDLLNKAGQLPPPPPQLMEAGGMLQIEYTSPLNRMQKAGDGAAILTTFEQLAPIAQVDPSVYAVFNVKRTAKKLADINGVPQDCFNTDDEQAANDAAKADQAEQQQILAAAPVAGKAAKDLTAAAANVQSNPNLGAMSSLFNP